VKLTIKTDLILMVAFSRQWKLMVSYFYGKASLSGEFHCMIFKIIISHRIK